MYPKTWSETCDLKFFLIAPPDHRLVALDFLVDVWVDSTCVSGYSHEEAHRKKQRKLDADRSECRKQPELHAVKIDHIFLIIKNIIREYVTEKRSDFNS